MLLNLLKSTGTGFNLSISNLSKSDFKSAKLSCLANCDISTPVAFLSQILLHNETNLIELLFHFN